MASKLSALLVQDRVVSFRQMDAAVQRQQQYGGRIGTNLLELGHVDEGILLYYISKQRHMPALENEAFASVRPEALAAWDARTAKELLAVPLGFNESTTMRVAVTEPLPDEFVRSFEERSGIEIEQFLALEFRIQQALNAFHRVPIPDRFVPLIERLPIPMGTSDGSIATTGPHISLASRRLPSGLHSVAPVFDAQGDEIPGLAWTGQQLAAFFETSVSRDHMLMAALGFAGKFFSRRILFLVTKLGLRGYALQMPGEPDRPIDRAETPVADDSPIGRLIAGESYFFGALEHTGLSPLYEQLGLPAPPDVCVIPVKVGPRAALLLVGDSGEERIDAQALPIIFLAVNRLAEGLERLIRRLKLRRSADHALAKVVDSPLEERSRDVRQETNRLAAIVDAQREELISAASEVAEPAQEGVNRLPDDGWDFDDSDEEPSSEDDSTAETDSEESPEDGAGETDRGVTASFAVSSTGQVQAVINDTAQDEDEDEDKAQDEDEDKAQDEDEDEDKAQDEDEDEKELDDTAQESDGEQEEPDEEPRDNNATMLGFSPPPISADDEDEWLREPTNRLPPIAGSPVLSQEPEDEREGTTPLSGIANTKSMTGLPEEEDDVPTRDQESETPGEGNFIDPIADSTLSLIPNDALTAIFSDLVSDAETRTVSLPPADTRDTTAVKGEAPRIAHQLDTSSFETSFSYEDRITGAVSLFGLRRLEDGTGQELAVGALGRQDPIDLDVRLPGVLQPPLLREPENEEEVAFANEILNAHNSQLIEWLTSEEALRSNAAFMTLLDRGQDAHDELLEVFPGPLTVDRRAPQAVMEPKPLERHGPVVWLLALQLRSVHARLRDLTLSEDADVRYYAARLLDQAADSGALERMADLLFDLDSQVRDTALTFIEKQLTKEDRHLHPVLPAIRARLNSHEPWIVDVAITTINRLRDSGAVQDLLGTLSAESPHTRQRAAQALSELTFQDFGVNSRRWNKWFRRNGSSTRGQWLLAAMVGREWKVRDNASRELRTLQDLIVNYSPEFGRKQLDSARRTVHRYLFGHDGGPS